MSILREDDTVASTRRKGRLTRSRTLQRVLLLMCAVALVSCTSPDEPPGHRMGVSRLFYVTNFKYRRRMNTLFRLSRAVPTDSLSRLYVARLRTPAHSHELSELVACEYIRLGLVYGGAVADLAIERMRDSLAREHYPVRRIYALMAGPDHDLTEFGRHPCFADIAKLPDPPDSLNQEPMP